VNRLNKREDKATLLDPRTDTIIGDYT